MCFVVGPQLQGLNLSNLLMNGLQRVSLYNPLYTNLNLLKQVHKLLIRITIVGAPT